jgi:hypothetical protein
LLLRASGAVTGNAVDPAAVTDDAAAAGSGIDHAETLLAFAEATVKGSDTELARARTRLQDELGPECLVDAAAVVSNFERMVRIADSTGIPLDTPVNVMSEDLRADLGLNAFGSSANTSPVGRLGSLLGPRLQPLALLVLRLAGARMRRRS